MIFFFIVNFRIYFVIKLNQRVWNQIQCFQLVHFNFIFYLFRTVLQAHQIVVVKIDIVLLIFDRKQDQHLFWYEIGSTLKSWKCLKTNLFLNDVAKSIINKNMFFVSGTVHNVVICYIVVNNVSRMQFCQTK